MADSTMAEFPQAWSMRKSDGEYRWAYTQGLVTLGLYRLSKKHDDPEYYRYMKEYVDHYAEADGGIRTLALGGDPYRDGSYDYYVSTDVVINDAHGVGAFLLASAEIE